MALEFEAIAQPAEYGLDAVLDTGTIALQKRKVARGAVNVNAPGYNCASDAGGRCGEDVAGAVANRRLLNQVDGLEHSSNGQQAQRGAAGPLSQQAASPRRGR